MKKILILWVLMSFALVFASAEKIDIDYDGSRYMSLILETGTYDTYSWYENDKEYVRYAFANSNNANNLDDLQYEIIQLPLAIGRSMPEISVYVLESQDFEHQVSDHELFSISTKRQFRDKDFVYISINPFLKNSRVATKIKIDIDLKENGGKPVENKLNRFFVNKDFADGLRSNDKFYQSLEKTANFNGEWLDIRVDEEGIYAINRQDIVSAGISSDFTDQNLYLYAGPGFGGHLRNEFPDSVDFHLKQIPLLFLASANENDDRWIFYASPNSFWDRQSNITNIKNLEYIRNSYEEDQHFRLFVGTGAEPALRMEQDLPQFTGSEEVVDHAYHRLHKEEELINPGKGGEIWFGERLSSSNTYPFYLNNLYSGNVDAAIRLSFGMTTAGTHAFSVFAGDSLLNTIYDALGKSANDYDYESSIVARKQLTIPNSALTEDLDIRVNYQGSLSTSEGFLDYIDIIYPIEPEAIDGQLDLWFLASENDRKIRVNDLNASISYVFEVEDPFMVDYFPVSGSYADVLVPASITSNSFMVVNESHFKTPAGLSILPDFEPLVSDDHAEQVDFIIITPDAFYSEAQRLAAFKESRDLYPLKTFVKSYTEIIGQYNAGNRDPYAIWHFLADMYNQNPAPKPMYVLLFGDGHYDYQNRLFSIPSYIPHLYEPGILWPCDDIYVMINSPVDLSNDMAIGRLPVNSIDEAKAVVDKIIEYDSRINPGEWQLNAMLVADDPTDLAQGSAFVGQTVFIKDSERLYDDHLPKVMQTKKVYLTEYPERYITELQTMGRDGAREDIMKTFLNGVSFVNFYGHGDPSVWTQEKVFVSNDLTRLDVNKQYPFIMAATCSWGRSDNPDYQSMAEDIVSLEANGAIATMATVRSVFHGTSTSANVKFVQDFCDGLFEGYPDYAYTPLMGDAVLYAKNESNNQYGTTKINNNMKFMYFGDPTIIPAFTQHAGMIDSVSRDTLRALDRVSINGTAIDREGSAPLAENLEGLITIYDNDYKVSREYVYNTSGSTTTIGYYLEGSRLFNGNIDFTNNNFAAEAFIPKDIQYHGTHGKIRMMYWNENNLFDGAAAIDDIHVGGINPNAAADVTGPQISVMKDDMELQNGAVVFDTNRVRIVFEDVSGINITGTTGHVLEMNIDNGLQVVDLSELFSYDQNDYSRGGVEFYVNDYLDEGEHLIEITAFDNYNNYSNVELNVTVLNANDDIIQNMVNFPNPFKDNTDVTFSSAFNGTAELRVYTISGKPVNSMSDINVNAGFNAIPFTAEDEYGHKLAAGVYFYVLEIDTGLDMIKQHSKMVILP